MEKVGALQPIYVKSANLRLQRKKNTNMFPIIMIESMINNCDPKIAKT